MSPSTASAIGFEALTACGAFPVDTFGRILRLDREVAALTPALSVRPGSRWSRATARSSRKATTATAFSALTSLGNRSSGSPRLQRSLARRAYGS